MSSTRELESNPHSQADFLLLWARLISIYTKMVLTKPRDRTFAFQGITSHMVRLSGREANGCGTRLSFFDGLPVACLLPSLLWVAGPTDPGERPNQNITSDNAEIRVETWCYVNTLSWASIEGPVSYRCSWPFCAESSPRTTVFAPGFSSGNFTPQKRTQIVHLFPSRNDCEAAEDNHDLDNPVESSYKRPCSDLSTPFQSYRYCTRVLSLIHVRHLLSRVILEGPAFSFTTECTSRPKRASPGYYETRQDHHTKRDGFKNMLDFIWFDLAFSKLSQTPFTIEVTCVAIIEWDYGWWAGTETDMGVESPDSWQPDCAAGIVLIKRDNGGKDSDYGGNSENAQEFYTRIGYWELIGGNQDHPPYGPIREEAKVRRVVVI